MKKATLILLCLAFLPVIAFGQLKKKLKSKGIYVSTTLNYYPKVYPYETISEFVIAREVLDLTFLTANSGTFIIEGENPTKVERFRASEIPSQILNVGASLQVINTKGLFQEISLTKLSASKSSDRTVFVYKDTMGSVRNYVLGYRQKTTAFAFRYEFGKYFGKRKNAPMRFGLSGSIEPSFYSYKRTPTSSQEYPIEGRFVTVDVALIPMLNFRLAKKVYMDFKVIPNLLLGDFGSIREINPTLPPNSQGLSRDYSPPDLSLAFSVLLRYEFQKARRNRREE